MNGPNGLPAADPALVADTVAALPGRLRPRLDAAVAAAGDWRIEPGEDALLVHLPGGAIVTLTPGRGVLQAAEQIRCGCLLAPACLHRAAVLVAAPVGGDDDRDGDTTPGDPPGDPPGDDREVGDGVRVWTVDEQEAAARVAQVAAEVLAGGLPGAGAVVQTDLLRALHHARAAGLHRLAGAATRVVNGVRAGRADDPGFALAALTRDLLDVLRVADRITAADPDADSWRGRARTAYAPVGSLRLSGLCLEPVLTSGGYAGVVVWLLDADGRQWSVSDVRPGGPERVRAATHAAVALGDSGLSHRELSRAGLVVAGATANADGRLGAGAGVRAVRAEGTAWTDPPLRRRFGGLMRGPLRLLEFTLCAASDDALLAVDDAGRPIRLVAPGTGMITTYQDNLRLLAHAPGLRLLGIGRPAAQRADTVELLAVGGGDLVLPAEYGGRLDLGIDRLSPAFARPRAQPPSYPGTAVGTLDPLDRLARRLERVVAGGRATLAGPGTAAGVRADAVALRTAQLRTGADLLEALAAAAYRNERDAFGRFVDPEAATLARRWLAMGEYLALVADR